MRYLILLLAISGCTKSRSFAPSKTDGSAQELLTKYVTLSGKVDYQSWKDNQPDIDRLDGYLAKLTNETPDTNPKEYPTVSHQISYWTNLYNLLVLREVLRHWPLGSVREVKVGAVSYLVPGKGFFANTRFSVAGKSVSLDDIEHEILRSRYKDARIHFVLNCGSNSCPPLPRKLFTPATFDDQVQTATEAFINDTRNVSVNHGRKQVRLSKIFKWYDKDFVKHAKRAGASPSVIGFVTLFGKNAQLTDLKRAANENYAIVYEDYDWGVNSGEALPSALTPVSQRKTFAGGSFSYADGSTWNSVDTKGQVVLLDFWATYCEPCKEILPKLQKLDAIAGFVVIPVSLDDDPAHAQQFLDGLAISLKSLFDAQQVSLEPPLSIKKLPTEILLDKQGRVAMTISGNVNEEELTRAIEELLKE